MKGYFMFMERKTQYFQNVSSSQLDLQIQHYPSYPREPYCAYQQIDLKVYIDEKKTQNSQRNFEGEQSWKTDIT